MCGGSKSVCVSQQPRRGVARNLNRSSSLKQRDFFYPPHPHVSPDFVTLALALYNSAISIRPEMRWSVLSSLIFAISTIFTTLTAAFNFDDFDNCTQKYMYKYAPQSCSYGDIGSDYFATFKCLCQNRMWLTQVSKAVGRNCGQTTLQSAAVLVQSDCVLSGTYAVLSASDMVNVGQTNQSNATVTTGSPPQPTANVANSILRFRAHSLGSLLWVILLTAVVSGIPMLHP